MLRATTVGRTREREGALGKRGQLVGRFMAGYHVNRRRKPSMPGTVNTPSIVSFIGTTFIVAVKACLSSIMKSVSRPVVHIPHDYETFIGFSLTDLTIPTNFPEQKN